jgi:hypothetical protein
MAAVATLSPRLQIPLLRWMNTHAAAAHYPTPAEMRDLFEGAGFTVGDQHRVRRPLWTKIVSDLITVGTKS